MAHVSERWCSFLHKDYRSFAFYGKGAQLCSAIKISHEAFYDLHQIAMIAMFLIAIEAELLEMEVREQISQHGSFYGGGHHHGSAWKNRQSP